MIRVLRYIYINLVSVLFVIVCLLFIQDFNPLLILIPSIVFFAWTGGFMLGFFTTILSLLEVTLMLFFPINHPLLSIDSGLILEMALFIFIGTFISYIIHISKQQDRISDYQRRLRQNHHVVELLEHNYENAKKEIKARDQFLAIASHELKTPVTSMLLEVQTAIHNIKNVSLANFSVVTLLKMLEDTEQQSKRLSKMVNDLLDLSLITTGKIDLEFEETNITNIIRNVTERFKTRLVDKTQLNLIISRTVIGYCDKLRIEQAVTNLVSNAIKYGNNKPIYIKVLSIHDHVKISVSDSGIGIPHDHQKKIFNRFERAVSPRDYKGLGVGLYITSQIVKAHNGKIQLVSEPGNGSIFTIEIPVKQKTISN